MKGLVGGPLLVGGLGPGPPGPPLNPALVQCNAMDRQCFANLTCSITCSMSLSVQCNTLHGNEYKNHLRRVRVVLCVCT